MHEGAAIFVEPTEKSYQLASDVGSISITNTSEKEIRLVDTLPKQDDYRVSAYLADERQCEVRQLSSAISLCQMASVTIHSCNRAGAICVDDAGSRKIHPL